MATVFFASGGAQSSNESGRLPQKELISRLLPQWGGPKLRYIGITRPAGPNGSPASEPAEPSEVLIEIQADEADPSGEFERAGYYLVEGLHPRDATFLISGS